ncbi:MAG: alcohol dehydrogenase family protein [Chloroflexota bacterium]
MTTDTMTAMQLTGFGGLEMLQLATVPRPQAAPGELLIRVGACGLNNTDLNLRKGWYSPTDDAMTGWQQNGTPFPLIQGADIVGEVITVGAGVDVSRVGQRVMVNPTIYRDHPENPLEIDFIGSERPGGFAEYVAVPAANAYPVESPLADVELATFATSYLTAEHMLERANITAGETVLVTGASGGVGSALLQLVRARSAQAIAIVGRSKEAFARELGAVDVLPRDVDDIEAATAHHTIDAVADVVGGDGFSALMHAVRPGGRIVTCGAIAGPLVQIDLRTLYLRNIALIGSTLGTASEFAALVGYINDEKIKPLLAATFTLEQLREAQQAFEEKQFHGKIVITIN